MAPSAFESKAAKLLAQSSSLSLRASSLWGRQNAPNDAAGGGVGSEVVVRRVGKKFSVMSPPDTTVLPFYVAQCFRFWLSPWVFVDRPLAGFKAQPPPSLDSLPELTFEADFSSSASVQGPLTLQSLQESVPEPTFPTAQFSVLYNPQWDWGRGTAYVMADRNFTRLGDPNTLKIFQQPESIQFLVEPAELQLQAGNHEPFFCSLALYHISLKQKISETFHYAFDSSGHLDLVRNVVGPDLQGDLLDEDRCVFNVALPSKYVHLVLTVHRVLQGDEEKTAEPYLLEGEKSSLGATLRIPFQNSARKLARIKEHTQVLCSRIGTYRQSFAFASLPVFDDAGRFTLADGEFGSFFLLPPGNDFDLCDAILNPGSRRLKAVDAKCKVSARRIGAKDFVHSRINASLTPLDSAAALASSGAVTGPRLRDMFDLSSIAKPLPYTGFVSTLFVYPEVVSLAVDRKKSIVLRFELRASDDGKVTMPLKLLFSTTGAVRRILTDTANISVVHGEKNSTWLFEELRVHLPPNLTDRHHLMCFFSEVDVDAVRKEGRSAEAEKLIGVSIIRLLDRNTGALVDVSSSGTLLSLPVISCESALPRGYLAMSEAEELPFLENGKELFQVRVRGVSSTLSANNSIATVMKLASVEDADWSDEHLAALMTSLNELRNVNLDVIVPHFPTLFQVLLQFMDSTPECAQQDFQTCLILCYRIHTLEKKPSDRRTGLMHHFIEYAYDPFPDTTTYNAISAQWVTLLILMKKGVVEDPAIVPSLICSVSWMLFDMIVKTMILQERDESLPRIEQYMPEFARILKKLLLELRLLLWSLVASSGGGLKSAVEEAGGFNLNVNMAMFLSDLLVVYDRGLVLGLVVQHIDEFRAQIALKREAGQAAEASLLTVLLLDFLKLFSDHEHFVQLNLPKPHQMRPELTNLEDLLEKLEEKHVLPGKMAAIVVQELVNPLASRQTRALALSVLANLLIKIDRDERFQAALDRHCIALMFFPLWLRVMLSWSSMQEWRKGENDETRLHERQELAASLIWILSNLQREWLVSWWTTVGAESTFLGFVPILEDLLAVCCTRPEVTNLSTPFLTVSGNVDSLMDMPKHGLAGLLKTRARLGIRSLLAPPGSSEGETQQDAWIRFKYVSHHVIVLILKCCNDFMSHFDAIWARAPASISAQASAVDAPPISLQMANLLCSLLTARLSFQVMPNMFETLKRFVFEQGAAMFRTTLKAETSRIITAVLRLCSSASPDVRAYSSSFIYFLILQNSKFGASFEVVKNAAILASSRLAEDHKDFGGARFQSALDCIAEHALHALYDPKEGVDEDVVSVGRVAFVKQVQEMCRALAAIVRDTQEIVNSRGSSDVEKVAEQYFRMAEGYRYSPELRLEWLEKLAQFHARNEDYPEAAISMAHVLALVVDYLNTCTDSRIPVDVFKSINPALVEFYSEEASAGGSSSFSLRHMKFVAKAVIKFLGQAELYEMASDVHRLLLTVYHAEGSYRDLTNAHMQLEGFYMSIAQNDSGRLLGRYFRVGFFGPLFGPDLNGAEFVYKEPLLTQIYQLKERLVEHFSKLFGGPEKVVVFDHGGAIDVSTLDPNKAYLQITTLRPVWPDEEESSRKSFIQRNTRLSSFAFETPFSQDGKVGQTTTAEQWMRRTILTTEHCFPYILKRVPVRSRREVVLSPIEIAVEMMQARIEKLQLEVSRNPPDSKTLQQVLQGSVLTTVNRGTVEYLEIFLSRASDFPQDHIQALQSKFRGFLKAAEDALRVNELIIDASQFQFHNEMKNGYLELCRLAEPLLDMPEEGESHGSASSPRNQLSASPRNPPSSSPRPVGGAFPSPRAYLPPEIVSSSPVNSPKLGRRRARGGTGNSKPGSTNTSPRTSFSESSSGPSLADEFAVGAPQTLLKTASRRLSVRRAKERQSGSGTGSSSKQSSPRDRDAE